MKGLQGNTKSRLTIKKMGKGKQVEEKVIEGGSCIIIDGDCKTDEELNELKRILESTRLFDELEECNLEQGGDIKGVIDITKITGAASLQRKPKFNVGGFCKNIIELESCEGLGHVHITVK